MFLSYFFFLAYFLPLGSTYPMSPTVSEILLRSKEREGVLRRKNRKLKKEVESLRKQVAGKSVLYPL